MLRGAGWWRLALASALIAIGSLGWWVWGQQNNTPDPFRAVAIKNPPFPSLSYGMQAFLWWDDYAASLGLHWLKKADFTHVKQTFAWRDIEPREGEWHFERADEIVAEVESKGLQLVIRLGNTPEWAQSLPEEREKGFQGEIVDTPPATDSLPAWGEYCATIAKRYLGKVVAYQIWNEPNLAREWGGRGVNAVDYIELLRVCSEAIRAVDAGAILISAGLAPTGVNNPTQAIADDVYLRQLYENDFQRYVDVIGVHAAGFAAPHFSPADAERLSIARGMTGRWASFRRIEDLRRIMVEYEDEARQMAILEMGWTTDKRPDSPMAWFAVDPWTQAEYLRQAFDYAAENWRPWVGLMTVIYIADSGWTEEDEQYWWSLIHFKGEPKVAHLSSAFTTLLTMPKICDDPACP